MPTLNKRLLLRLFLLTLVLGVGLFLLNYVQSDRATEALRDQSERAANNGRLDKAILYMKRYLELRPGDHEAAAKLGQLILSRGNGRQELSSVLFLYERVLREAPERDDLRRKQVDICLRLNRYSDAMIHARTLLDHLPRDSEAWEMLAIAQSAQNKNDEARESLLTAIDCDPARITSYEVLVELLARQLHLTDEARDWAQKMVRANPAAAPAYLVRARYLRSQSKPAECLRDVERLLELDPENADGLLMLAELMQAKEQIDKAKAVLSEGSSLYQKDVRFYRTLSWLELSTGNLAAAVACLEQGLRELPQSTELLTPLGDLLVQRGEIERTRDIIGKLTGKEGVESQVQYLNGRVLMQEGKWPEAVAVFEDLRIKAVAMPGLAAQVNVLLATCQERLGDREAQAEALKRALAIDGGNLSARLQFGSNFLTSGDLDDAVKEYSLATRSPLAPLSARVALGRLMIARGKAGGAGADWNSVADYVNSLRDKFKNTVDPVLLSAEMLMERQQFDAAKKLLRQEAGKKVNDARIWSVLSAIALEADGLHEALIVLDEAQGLLGDQAEIRLARARAWAVDWQPGRQERIRALGFRADDFSEAEQIRLLSGLADVCTSIRDFEGVKLFQKHLAVRLPRDLSIRRALLDTATRTGDAALRKRLRGEVVAIGDESMAAVADALADLDSAKIGDPRVAGWHDLAVRALAPSPIRADAHLLLARLAEKASDDAEAERHYAQAIALEPSNLYYLELHLTFLLRHDEAAARKRAEQLFYDPRMPGEGYFGFVEGACAGLPTAQLGRCLTWIEPLAKKSNVSLLWLARIAQAHGLIEQARALASRATTAAPKLVDAWVARVWLQPPAVMETIAAARSALDEKAWLVFCAEIFDVARAQRTGWMPEFKKPDEPRTFAQARLNACLQRGNVKEATEALNLLAGNANARAEDTAWARRNLAVLAASRGGAADRLQAALALRGIKADAGASIEDLRSFSGSLALVSRHMHGAERRALLQQAIETLKRVTVAKEAIAEDWFHLAQLQRQVGEVDAYRASIKEAMRRDEGNLFYVTVYVDDLLKDGRLDEAETYLSRLLQATQDARAALTAATYFALANLPARSTEIIAQYMQAADPHTADAPARLRRAADMLDQLARLAAGKSLPCAKALIEAAIKEYRNALNNYPEAAGPLASLLAFDGKTADAFQLLTSMRASLAPKVLTTSAVAVLRIGGASPRQFQLVQSWIESALAENPNAAILKLNLAEVFALRQDYAAAEPLYREVLKSEPENIIALNNLAWILAPRNDASDEALKCVERAIELSGPSGELLDTRARIYIARGNLERAIEDVNQALEYSRTSLRCFHLAMAQFKQLKKNEAVHTFKEARARGLDPRMIHPNDMPTYKVLTSQME
jgi:cellulose synthase operon protein C